LAYALGLFYFLVYYFVIADALFHTSPTSVDLRPLTLYFILATVAFPQAYKYTGDRLDDLEINFFRLVVLPALYIVGPVVVLYSLFKKKD
ncbi:MAG: transcriptional regulator, partial [Aedoeadaptatus pacaensis]